MDGLSCPLASWHWAFSSLCAVIVALINIVHFVTKLIILPTSTNYYFGHF